MERGPDQPSPGWLKWYFIIGGSLFAVALITMGIIFAIIGDGNIYDDTYYEDDYERDIYVDAELFSEDDTLVFSNYGGYEMDWDEYTVEVDGWETDDLRYPIYYWQEVVFQCYQDIQPYTYYEVRIYDYWSGELLWYDTVYASYGYGS